MKEDAAEEQTTAEEKETLDEWEKSADDDAELISMSEEDIDLDQNEIDNLLGLEVQQGKQEIIGIKAMIDKALDSYERLPMLEVVFEKFIRLLSNSLRNLTEDNVDLDIRSIQSLRFGSYISSIPMPALVNVFRIKEWDNFGLFVADSALIFSLVDILFGGKKSDRDMKIEGRPYTSIEQTLVKQLTKIALSDLSESFETLSSVSFVYERMESDPRFASIARHGDSAVLIKIGIEIEEKKGSLEVLFPYEALEPIRELLTQVFVGEQFGNDSLWQQLLVNQVRSTNLTLEAILYARPANICDVANFKVGSTILMENNPDDDIAILCKGVRVSTGKLGKLGKKVAIALNKPIQNENSLEGN